MRRMYTSRLFCLSLAFLLSFTALAEEPQQVPIAPSAPIIPSAPIAQPAPVAQPAPPSAPVAQAAAPSAFQPPQTIVEGGLSVVQKYFDSSFSFSGTPPRLADEVTVAEKDGRVYLYAKYQLIGSRNGYGKKEFTQAFAKLPVKQKTLWEQTRAGTWITGGTGSIVMAIYLMFSTSTAAVPPVTGHATGIAALVALSVGPVVALGSMVREYLAGEVRVDKNFQTYIDQMNTGTLAKEHTEIVLASSNYRSDLEQLVQMLSPATPVTTPAQTGADLACKELYASKI